MNSFIDRWYPYIASTLVLAIVAMLVWANQNYTGSATPLPPTTVESVKASRDLGLQWLKKNFSDDDGIFLYSFNPRTAEVPRQSNALRQLMGSRVAATEAHHDEELAVIHEANLAFVMENWYQEDEEGGFVYFKDKSKLGANAMLLRTLVYSPQFDTYAEEAAALAKGIIALQQDDGSFVPWYREPNYDYRAYYLMYFYSGEAILALLEYYEKTKDEAVLEAAKRAADHYVMQYVEKIDENYHPAYVPWHTLSYRTLYQLTGEATYVGAIFRMNDRLLELLDTTNYVGRFYKDELKDEGQASPHSSSDSVYLEGLLYAYEIALQVRDNERAERYREAIDLVAGRLMRLQYQEARPDFEARPSQYVGAIPIREGSVSIRVDTTQHALDAFEKYLELFGTETSQ